MSLQLPANRKGCYKESRIPAFPENWSLLKKLCQIWNLDDLKFSKSSFPTGKNSLMRTFVWMKKGILLCQLPCKVRLQWG